MLQQTQSADTMEALPSDNPWRRVNLLNWDGKGSRTGLFPPRDDGAGAMRRRRRQPSPSISERPGDTWQVVSLLLDYPDEVLVSLVDARGAGARPPATVDAAPRPRAAHAAGALQEDYVDTFDVTRKCSLHLTYFT